MTLEEVIEHEGYLIEINRAGTAWMASLMRGLPGDSCPVDFSAGTGPTPEAAVADLRQSVEAAIWLY